MTATVQPSEPDRHRRSASSALYAAAVFAAVALLVDRTGHQTEGVAGVVFAAGLYGAAVQHSALYDRAVRRVQRAADSQGAAR
ncbi:hypothetical protein ABT369_39060 [Dactylosporangium sp. NPDC000244]|uniref:hypothetical protein n=1 Tax=Dactylosporangium sp. NPDC000244 TaxID=3154365 RepID=UPI00332390E1